MGTSNIEDIKAAYGEPSDTYEGDFYTKMTYQQDSYQRAELYVYKEENTLLQVDLRNFKEPEDFDKGSVSTEIPDIVSNYKAPTALGSDFMDRMWNLWEVFTDFRHLFQHFLITDG